MFVGVFILFILFICIVTAVFGYMLFFFLGKEKIAHYFYVFGMVLLFILLIAIVIRVL